MQPPGRTPRRLNGRSFSSLRVHAFSLRGANLPQLQMVSFLRSPVIWQTPCTQYAHLLHVLYSPIPSLAFCAAQTRLCSFFSVILPFSEHSKLPDSVMTSDIMMQMKSQYPPGRTAGGCRPSWAYEIVSPSRPVDHC